MKPLADSVIGKGTKVTKGEQSEKVMLFIGDDARIEL